MTYLLVNEEALERAAKSGRRLKMIKVDGQWVKDERPAEAVQCFFCPTINDARAMARSFDSVNIYKLELRRSKSNAKT